LIARDLMPLIDPKLHPKYSPNLYKWICKQWGETGCLIVVTNECSTGRYIGALHEDGWMSGVQLNAVLCNGAKEKTWALHPEHHGIIVGVDDNFWTHYIRDGRCAIDTDHQAYFIGDETRWKVTGGVRECLWCGHHVQVKLDWTEVVKHSAWVPA